MAEVILQNLYKTYIARGSEGNAVLKRIDLHIADGEFMVLVGPSGCGKSTLLRSIAGLETITAGTIHIGDRLVNDLPPKERNIAMVFQSYALYPHLRVYDNIAFGLRRRFSSPSPRDNLASLAVAASRHLPPNFRYQSAPEQKIQQQVHQVAQMLQIEGLLHRLPKQLSGGQKQRVALGRAIARDAAVFLMDEPLSNLDAKLRAETRSQIVHIQRHLGTTTIYVTHDQTEAMTMGDRIAVMYQGQIQQVDRPLTIYDQPNNMFVAQFIGMPPMNFRTARIQSDLLVYENWVFPLSSHHLATLQHYPHRDVVVGIRPEHLTLSDANSSHWQGTISTIEALGNDTFIGVALDHSTPNDSLVQARLPAHTPVTLGQSVSLALTQSRLHLFDLHTTQRL